MGWSSTLPMRSTIDRPRPRPAHRARRLLQPLELLEDRACACDLGMPGPVSQHQDAEPVAAPAHAEQHLAGRGVLDGIGDEVLQHAAQQAPVRAHPQRASARCAARAPSRAPAAANSTSSRSNTSFERKDRDVGLEPAGVEARDLDQNAEDLLDRLQRGIDVARERRLLAAERALDQARGVEPRRIERLQDVVAGRRQEARLVEVGLVGLALGDRQRLVDLGQLGRALPARAAPASRWRAPAPRRPRRAR